MKIYKKLIFVFVKSTIYVANMLNVMNEVEDFDFRLEAEMRYNRQKVCHGGVLLYCELTFEKPK